MLRRIPKSASAFNGEIGPSPSSFSGYGRAFRAVFVEMLGYSNSDVRYRFLKTHVKEALEKLMYRGQQVKVISHDRFVDRNPDVGDKRLEEELEAALLG